MRKLIALLSIFAAIGCAESKNSESETTTYFENSCTQGVENEISAGSEWTEVTSEQVFQSNAKGTYNFSSIQLGFNGPSGTGRIIGRMQSPNVIGTAQCVAAEGFGQLNLADVAPGLTIPLEIDAASGTTKTNLKTIFMKDTQSFNGNTSFGNLERANITNILANLRAAGAKARLAQSKSRDDRLLILAERVSSSGPIYRAIVVYHLNY